MIVYNGIEYPTRELVMGDGEWITVAPLTLQNAIMTDEGEVVGYEQEVIDGEVFWYCNEEEWELPDDKLIMYIKNIL